ncbi:hypothetical protein HF1_02620 [Mycoplasma haemofelis str. Langford 1]|uniref:Uncharacterized protein n=1 Tax=Mycoplasma haemofelis (strain Langford 1) TaxID=941640 RepID=E8ZKV4_MYCHL|nr:hypothetical protein [Mycoplasma haemofelis]CBY92270.1 hypothetical protein HF1_02620 [Mycoplasma haemofelis str. Langford 1]
MSIPTPAKAAMGALAGGSTVAGGSLVYKEMSKPKVTKKSVSELIKNLKKDKRLISASALSDPAWKATWKKYREDNKSRDSDVWGVTGWTKEGSIVEKDTVQGFINACKDKISREIEGDKDPLFDQVVLYCTRDTLVSDLIAETKGKTLLTKGDNFQNDTHWKAVWDLYKKDNTSSNKWNLSDWSSSNSQANVPASFAEECLKKSQVKEHRLDQPAYTEVLKYCTKDA